MRTEVNTLYDRSKISVQEAPDGFPLRTAQEQEIALGLNPLENPNAAPNGGSQPGAMRTLGPFPFPFAFDTPDLLTGVPVYTPADGEWLVDAWIVGPEVWNGTTPTGQVIFGSVFGIAGLHFSFDMTFLETFVPNNLTANGQLVVSDASGYLPARGDGATPIQVAVTAGDGSSDPGSDQGHGELYVVVTTPAVPS